MFVLFSHLNYNTTTPFLYPDPLETTVTQPNFYRSPLMEGLDMTGATLRDLDEIKGFRATHEAAFPWMTGLPGKAKRRLEGR